MNKDKWKERFGGIVLLAIMSYAGSARFGNSIDSRYIWIVFTISSLLILFLGNIKFGGKDKFDK